MEEEEEEVSVAEGAVVDLTDLHDLRSRLPNRVTKNLTYFYCLCNLARSSWLF